MALNEIIVLSLWFGKYHFHWSVQRPLGSLYILILPSISVTITYVLHFKIFRLIKYLLILFSDCCILLENIVFIVFSDMALNDILAVSLRFGQYHFHWSVLLPLSSLCMLILPSISVKIIYKYCILKYLDKLNTCLKSSSDSSKTILMDNIVLYCIQK